MKCLLSGEGHSPHHFGERMPELCCSQTHLEELSPIRSSRDSMSREENSAGTHGAPGKCSIAISAGRAQSHASACALLLFCNSFFAFHKISKEHVFARSAFLVKLPSRFPKGDNPV